MKPIRHIGDITAHAPDYESSDIFKYGDIEYLERTLNECTIRFSPVEEYNDLFEIKYKYIQHSKDKGSQHALLYNRGCAERMKSDKVNGIASDYFSRQVSTCFSATPFEPLMWSHYANKHKGICYCFNKIEIFDTLFYRPGEIIYSSHLPTLNYFDGVTSNDLLIPQLEKIILTKSDVWAYEKEYRFFIESSELGHSYSPSSLEAIIVGSRGQSEIATIEKHVANYNKKHDLNVFILYANASSNSYSMTIRYNSMEQSPSITCPIFNPSDPAL